MHLPHPGPAFDIRQSLQGNQHVPPLDLGKGRELGPIHDLEPVDRPVASDAKPGRQRIVLVDIEGQRPPQRDAALAGSGPGFYRGFDAGRPIGRCIANFV